MDSLLWVCLPISAPADARPYSRETRVDVSEAWGPALEEVKREIPAGCLVCEDIIDIDTTGTRCTADCAIEGGGSVTLNEENLTIYDEMWSGYRFTGDTQVSVRLPEGSADWTSVELDIVSDRLMGEFGSTDEGTWSGSWEGSLLSDWPADGTAEASWSGWAGDTLSGGWEYMWADGGCAWSSHHDWTYAEEAVWTLVVDGTEVYVVDGIGGCEATMDGRTTEVECDDWRPEEPPEEGCGGVALFPLWLLAGRRRSASR